MPVKNARRILALKKRKDRQAERKYLIEGIRLSEEAVRSDAPAEQFIFDREAMAGNERLRLLNQDITARGIEVQETDRRAMRGMCDTQTPQGVLGVVRMAEWDRDSALSTDAILLLDRIRDPGNLGLLLRTAEAAGVGAIFCSSESVELHNPKVVRASMGSIFRVPFFPDQNLSSLIPQLQERQVSVLCTRANAEPYDQVDPGSPYALLLGNEAFGIEPRLLECADHTVSLPMVASVESLNVAVAAGILLYHFNRKQLGPVDRP